MKVLNYGSLNVDYVYSVDHIIVGGETQHSSKLEVFSGGKGLNQSIALAKAGVTVYHAGIVGTDGDILLDACKEAGVNTKYIRRLPVKGGHTMIQVDKNAQNCIILYGGTNQMQTKEFVDEVLADFGEGDYLMLQNEINMLDYIIDQPFIYSIMFISQYIIVIFRLAEIKPHPRSSGPYPSLTILKNTFYLITTKLSVRMAEPMIIFRVGN